MLRCYAILAALVLVGLTTFDARADRRVAFVIGNSEYRNIPALKNPDNDVDDVSNTFRQAGFNVFLAKDVTRLQFEEQFRNYLAAADGADLAVVYYSGHGFQIGGENFLIPVDASLKDAADIEVQAVKLDDVLEQLRSKSKIQVIILDACRNNPFPRKDYWLRDQLIATGGTGLAQVKSSQNTLIAFATEPGAIAYDGSGDLSPFSSAFSRRALAPNQEIRTVMAAVRRDVVKATDGKQVPWENSSLIDDVVLMRRVTRPSLPPFEEYEALLRGVWQRNYLTNAGPLVVELERQLAAYLGVRHCLFVTNGTIALQLAYRALALRGEVVTTPFSYVATTSSLAWEGCEPVFADIEPDTLTLSPERAEAAITPRTSAIVATHVYGNACDIEALGDIGRRRGIPIVYDAAHAFGASFHGRALAAWGDVATLSFHATKLFHTVEGGAVVTNDDTVARNVAALRNFGHEGYEAFGSNGNGRGPS